MESNTSNLTSTSAIASFFHGKTIFITGATGFVGKCLLEKLFRSCPDVELVYILVRRKRDLKPIERVTQLCSSPLFDTVRVINPNFTSKLNVIEGDLTLPEFGLTKTDEAMLIDQCHVVFHVAANTRFDMSLKTALQSNVGSVEKLVRLCSKMTSVQAIVHVSTAYANCDRAHIDEIVYPTPVTPDQLLATAEWMDESMFHSITPSLLRSLPNTYTFTKGLAESYLATHAKHLPLVILRPSIIGPAWKEPIPGFVDNYSGYTGLIAVMGSGLMRVALADPTVQANTVPIDTVINMMLTLAWHTATGLQLPTLQEKDLTIPVVHCCAAGKRIGNKCLTFAQLTDIVVELIDANKFGLEKSIRWPQIALTPNKYVYAVRHLLQESLIAYIIDIGLRLTRKKPILVHLSNKMSRLQQILSFVLNKNWTFASENGEALYDVMSTNEGDRQLFNFDLRALDWTEYLRDQAFGIKRYLFKEDMSQMTKCYERNLRLKSIEELINNSMIIFVLLLVCYLFTVFFY